RRELHRLVGGYLEATQPQPDHGLLVHHYRHAGEVEKTRLHAVRASESSVAAYAGLEAIDYLAVALGTTKGRNSADACVRSRLEELTGDSCEALGRGDDAIAFYKRARRRWRSPNVRRAATSALKDLAPLADGDARDGLLCWKIAHSLERGHSAYRRALDWLDTGAAALPAGSEGTAARMLVSRSGLLSRLGRFREAAEAGEQGLALARQAGDPAQLAYALTMLGTAMDGLGLLERAIACHTEAIAHYDQIGDLWGLAMGHLNLSASFQLAGDLRASLVHDETALALFARIGNFGGVVIQHLNVGVVLLEMGEVGPALEHLREAISLRDRQGVNPLVTGSALIFLGRALLWSDDLPGAQRALDEGRAILEHIDAQGALLDAGIIQAELCLALGDLDGAERASANALKSAKSMDAELGQAQALCALGSVRLARGDPVGATARLEACVSLAEKSGSDYERAKALVVLAEAQSACAPDDVECIATFDEAIRILAKVGARHDLDKAVALRKRHTTPAAGEGRRKPGPGPSPARSRSAAP
ncbi:MAG: hypothetical protein WCN81_15960, partial [Actinomycetes bacterium]